MGHCGGTDPYCQQGCSPTCANCTYMTGIESSSARKDPSAESLVGRFGARGQDQPCVGQRVVQEAMRKIQEGPAGTRIQDVQSQHQGRTEGHTPTKSEKWKMGSISVVTPTSLRGNVGDDKQSSNNIVLAQQNVMSSTSHTVPENVVADEDGDAEYEVDEQQKRCWTGAPRRPPGPVQRRGLWAPPTWYRSQWSFCFCRCRLSILSSNRERMVDSLFLLNQGALFNRQVRRLSKNLQIFDGIFS
jgi:hypothetical protein